MPIFVYSCKTLLKRIKIRSLKIITSSLNSFPSNYYPPTITHFMFPNYTHYT